MTLTRLRKRELLPFWLVGVCVWAASSQAQPPDQVNEIARIRRILARAHQAMAEVHDYRGTLIKRERFGDELLNEVIAFKFSRPYKIYAKYLQPNEGREALYVRGWNRGRVRAHKGSVPNFSVNLHPRGRIAMQNNHHPITSFGLESILQESERNIRRGIVRGDVRFRVANGGLVHGDATVCIEAETTMPGDGREVTVRRDENLWELAKRVRQNMYVILHHNDDIDSPNDVRAGQRVFVPYHYASRGQYCFSRNRHVLIRATSWDHYGKLYESYEHPDLELNPGLSDADFDPQNEEYDF